MAKRSKSVLSQFKDEWDEAEVQTSNKWNDVPPGRYACRCQSVDIDEKDDVPFVQFNYVVVQGPETNKKLVNRIRIEDSGEIEITRGERAGETFRITEKDQLSKVKTSFKHLGFDVESNSPEDMAEQAAEEQPGVTVQVKSEWKVWSTGPITTELPEIEDMDVEDDEEEEEEYEDEDEDEGEEEEDDETEDVIEFEVGDMVVAQPPRTRSEKEYKVLTVNQTKQTATLKNGTKKFTNVPWDNIVGLAE